MMNDKIFKQYEDPWKDLPYPTDSSDFGENGCGPCAVLHVAIEQESKKNWTPDDVRVWMIDHGYAVPGHGTEWQGIEAALKWIGHEDVVWVKKKDPMSMAWEELDKGNRIGVLLVNDGSTPDGTEWTTDGHFVSFNKYWKDSNGNHWFNIKDSGWRNHDGEFCYERSLMHALPQLWIVERIGKEPGPTPPSPSGEKYTGPFPVVKWYLEPGDRGENVTRLQNYLNWYTDGQFFRECGGADGIYGKNTLRYVNKMLTDFFGASEADGKVGNKTIAKMKAYEKPVKPQPTPSGGYTGPYPDESEIRTASNNGIHNRICSFGKEKADSGEYHYVQYTDVAYTHECPDCHKRNYDRGGNCIWWDFFCWHHGGKIPCACSCGVLYDGICDRYLDMSDADILADMKRRIGVNDLKLIRNGNKGIPQSSLMKGDALIFYDGDAYKHMAGYIGNGKITDCSSGQTPNIKYGKSYNYSSARICKLAIRYTGSLSYIQKGDEGTAVLKWQDFLNWWSDGAFYKECGPGDIYFGNNTHKWTVKFQEEVMGKGQGDGTVGPKTIAAAQSVRK